MSLESGHYVQKELHFFLSDVRQFKTEGQHFAMINAVSLLQSSTQQCQTLVLFVAIFMCMHVYVLSACQSQSAKVLHLGTY